ncbi:hypothetical protein JB92DRAFT_2792778 [Gautieria morchelliformis]|nr:hypothetical protein JB92DRAFT_2792778 [Gautieria morchelliformis]
MSLPPARKQISVHPEKDAVTAPVDKDQLSADVDRKLRFYSVIQALRAGRLPDNAQIDQTLQYVAEHPPVDLSKLSPAGQQLVNDTKDIIETARLMVKEKNADELFQNFIWHTHAVDIHPAKRDAPAPAPLSPEKAKEDGEKAAHHLRTLLTLLVTNAEARKLLADLQVVGRDLLARSADFIRPSDEELGRVDQDAPREGNEPPEANEREANREEPAANGVPRKNKEGAQAQVGSVVGKAKESVDTATEQAKGHAGDAAPTKERATQSFKQRVAGLGERVPKEHRERAHGMYERAHTFLDEEYFPPERRTRFVYRAKKVILECQKDSDYQASITWFFDTLAAYGHEGARAAGDARDGVRQVWTQGALKDAKDELLTLLSRFANNTSMQPVLDAVQGLYDVAREDEGLRAWFGRVREWGRRTLLEPGYVLEADCTNEGNEVKEQGRKYFDEKYKGQFDALFDAVGEWSTNLTHDPLNERFGHDWARLTRDLLFDAEGALTWKPALWKDIRSVIVPQLVDKVGYIPIPRVEYTDDDLDLVVENLALSGRNVFPNIVAAEAHNFARFSPYSTIEDESYHDFTFTLGQMQADMRDVMFYFNKKTGVAKMKDSGVADILIGGEGITATVHLHNAAKDAPSIFHITAIHVKVDTLKFSIRDSKHDVLYRFLRPFATGLVKRQVQRALRDAIRTALELVDQQLVRVRDRMGEVKEGEGGTTRTQALKELFKRHVDEANAKAKERERQEKRHSQFKVVAKRDSLLLPDQGNPHGWVNKQQEQEELVRQGHEWRSKAFTIVPESTARA